MLLIISLLSLAGTILSLYLLYKKRSGQKMVCIVGDDCSKVLESKYNKTFGVPNELLGVLYYLFVFVLATTSQIIFLPDIFFNLLIISGIGAGLFSIFLVYLQIFVIRELCEYCMASAAFSIAIAILEIIYFF